MVGIIKYIEIPYSKATKAQFIHSSWLQPESKWRPLNLESSLRIFFSVMWTLHQDIKITSFKVSCK